MPLTLSIMAMGAHLLGMVKCMVSCYQDIDVADNMAGVGKLGVSGAGYTPMITALACKVGYLGH